MYFKLQLNSTFGQNKSTWSIIRFIKDCDSSIDASRQNV